MKCKFKVGFGILTVLATPIAVNELLSSEVNAEYRGSIFYNNSKPADWWYSDGKDWYFFQNGKKLTGYGKDNTGTHYFYNGKYADWWHNDGQAWYFFQNGKKLTGYGKDNAGTHYFVNGKYANGKIGNKEYKDGKEISVENKVPTRGYANGVYYVDSKPANWWYSDGKDWYFFQNGKKLTGYGKDNAGSHYFYNGKYTNWWYDDGEAWYFFENGKKLTGYGKDNAGTHYFVNGKYANGKIENKEYRDGKEISVENKVPTRGYANGVYYVDSKPANWWYDDGEAWYFFQNGKKLTGYGKDNAGTHYFVNGKYANGKIGNKEYRDGEEISLENKVPTRGYANGVYYVDSKPANWWYDDGKDWYFFQNGRKLTGYGKDNAGTHYFVNGKYQQTNLQKVLDTARSYLGVETGSREHKKIVDAYNSVDPKPVGYTANYQDDWCDIFVTTVYQQAGLSDLIGRECGVQRHIGIMEKKGIWKGRTQPKVGDIVTFDWDGGGWADHIGIVESVNNGVITTIEGNSSLYAGSTAKTKVNRKTYNWNSSYIKGYARPAY